MTPFVRKILGKNNIKILDSLLLRVITFFVIINISLFSREAEAGFFDDLGACFTDPCSCGNGAVDEQWQPDGQTIKQMSLNTYDYPANFTAIGPPSGWPPKNHIGSPNKNCPPYDRYSGRRNCLYQFDAPSSPFLGTYRVYCAEADPSATYKNPTIKLRMQSCNIFACWTQSTNLNALSSECVTWPTQYGIPTIRFCTRVAVNRIAPHLDGVGNQVYRSDGTPDIAFTPDPGYHYHFLDRNGFPRPDPGIKNSAGYTIYLPKICLYEDPSFVEALAAYMEPYRKSGIDVFDHDIYSQPLQYSPEGLGVMDLLMGAQGNQLVESEFYFSDDSDFFTRDMMNYSSGKSWDTSYSDWVKEFAVHKRDSLGCVFLPIGPFPPPFCDTLSTIKSSVNIQNICPKAVMPNATNTGSIYGTVDSTSTNPCVKSTVDNNFIKNAVRATIDNIVPICKNASANPLTSTSCVKLISGGVNISTIYYNLNDMLPKCNNSTSPTNAPCIVTSLAPVASNGNFRIVYGIKSSSSASLRQVNGFPSNILRTCSSNSTPTTSIYPCVDIYGINNGSYKDIIFDLSNPNNVSYTNNYTVGSAIELEDENGRTYEVKPYISYQGSEGEDIAVDNINLPPNSMCLSYEAPSLTEYQSAGCVSRAPYPLMYGYDCSSLPAGHSCSTLPSHFNPQMMIALSYQNAGGNPPSDTAFLTIGARNLTSVNFVNMLGYMIDSLVVDADQFSPPFPVGRQINNSPNSIWGQYADNILPLDASGHVVSTAEYIGKIEYLSGVYNRGGAQLVALGASATRCHTPIPGRITATGHPFYDNSNCVLSLLRYQDKVNCTTFKNSNARRKCSTAEVTSCTQSTTIPLTGSAGAITIMQCTDSNCYIPPESMPLEVCQIDNSPAARVIPSYTSPNISIGASQYYDYTAVETGPCQQPSTSSAPPASSGTLPEPNSSPYDVSKCGMRDKTIIEKGVSATIPEHPKCQAVTSATQSSGYATWPQTSVGASATGSCEANYQAPAGGLGGRLCYSDNDRNAKFVPIATATTCVAISCPDTSVADVSSGYATWSTVTYGESSTPTCQSGLTAPTGGFTDRKCAQQSSGSYALDPMKAGEWCYAKTANLAGANSTVTLSSTDQQGYIQVGAATRVNNRTSYSCCHMSCGIFGCCAGQRGTCYNDNWSTKYTVSVGHPSYFATTGTPQWLTPNPVKPTTYTVNVSIANTNTAKPYTINNVNISTEPTTGTTSSTVGNAITVTYKSFADYTGAKITFEISIPD